MEQYEYRNGPPAPRMVAELAMRHDALVEQLADAQATIAALQARVKELEAAKQYCEITEARKAEAYKEVEIQLLAKASLQAELERVRGELQSAEAGYFVAERELQGANNKYDELHTLIAALPKVEGEITCSQQFDSAWRLHYWQVEAYGVADECLYRLSNLREEEAKAYAALLKHRQGME